MTVAAFPRIPVGKLIAAGEAELKTGPFGTQLKASEYTEEGTPVINVRNIGMGSIKVDKLEFIPDATRDRLSSHVLRRGDIVFGRKGAVERHVFVRKEQDGWFQGSDCLRLRFNSPRVEPLDLSKIDFEKLAKRFEKQKPTSSDLERLKAAVKAQLERMVLLNRTRADYLDKFEALIEAYNNGSRNIEEIFKDLLTLTRVLTEEQGRHVREHLSEEELTIFDILTRPGPELSTEERDEVKKVARQLLEKLHELLVLGWRQKLQARAKVRMEIEDTLDRLPRAYGKDVYAEKCNSVFEHVYESYQGEGRSAFTESA
jgi:hypothetical protein